MTHPQGTRSSDGNRQDAPRSPRTGGRASGAVALHPLIWRRLGLRTYSATWQAMREFSERRDDATDDEIWTLQHPPVFTLGQAGKPEHLLAPGDIPVVRTDRGGQVTYHGPGQIVAYLLYDLRRGGIGVKSLVNRLEQAVIDLLETYGVSAATREGAPGVYVEGRKIASLGLRVRRGCSYHGVSLNLDNDLEPFRRINPCGFPNLEVTRLSDQVGEPSAERVEAQLASRIARQLQAALREA